MHFLKSIAFNFLIGNSDAHGKNFSYLHTANGYVLSPLYDLVSTQVYPQLAKEMSMSIGGEYEPDRITRTNFMVMAKELGVKSQLINDILDKLAAEIIVQAEKLKEMTTTEKLIILFMIGLLRLSKQELLSYNSVFYVGLVNFYFRKCPILGIF